MRRLFAIFFLGTFTLMMVAQSDVDTHIAVNDQKDPNTFVIIISNENYKYEQTVPYALNDGLIFKLYCEKTLGIPSKNIRYAADATLNDIRMQIMWLTEVMDAYQGEARAFFYYSGHGMPSENGQHAYILPVDGNSRLAGSGYSTEQLYEQLGKMPSRGTIVFLDACFSGARRDGQMLASNRGVAIKVKNAAIAGKMVVFSAAQGDETAYPFNEHKHGLFTYYLLSILQERGGCVSLGELSDEVTKNVSRTSVVENDKRQTPTIISSSSALDWRKWMIASKPASTFESNNSEKDTGYSNSSTYQYSQKDGEELFAQKKYNEAYDIFIQLANASPNNAELFYCAARCKEMLGDQTAMLGLLDKTINAFPKPLKKEAAPYLWARSQALLQANKIAEAIKDMNDYEKLMSTSVNDNFYYLRFLAELDGKLFRQALNDIQQAITMNPKETLYYAEKASLEIRVGHLDNAINTANQILVVDPNESDGYLFLGVAQCLKGNKIEGLQNLKIAQKMGNDQAESQIEKYK